MTEQKQESRTTRQRKPRWGRIIGIAALVGLVVVGGGAAAMTWRAKTVVDQTYAGTHMKKARDVSETVKAGKPISILMLGTDTGELGRNDKGRTDSMMIVTVNPVKSETTIMSIPRDALMAIPGYESTFPQKINAAYELGSAKTAIETVQNWLNVPIDYYALVNMGGLEKVVDEIGGVKVKSPLTFGYNPYTAHDTPGYTFNFTAGTTNYSFSGQDGETVKYHTMDGKTALAFSRMRYDDPQGDYGRQQRQRMVLEAVVQKAKKNPARLLTNGFMNSLSKSVKTDLTFGDMTTIGTHYLSATKTIKSDYIRGTGYNLTSGSTEVVSRAEEQRATNVLRRSLGLQHKETGNLYGGDISDAEIAAIGVPTLATQAQN